MVVPGRQKTGAGPFCFNQNPKESEGVLLSYNNSTIQQAMAKRKNNPSSASDKDDDTKKKKKSRNNTTEEVTANGGSSSAKTKVDVSTAASTATKNPKEKTSNNLHTSAASSSIQANGGKDVGNSFLKSLRLTKSQPHDREASDSVRKENKDVTAPAAASTTASKSNTKKNVTSSRIVNSDASSSRKNASLLAVFFFVLNVAAAAYIFLQNTSHNLNKMQCASALNKLQIKLSDTRDEVKLLRKAMESIEVGNQHQDVITNQGIIGSLTIEDQELGDKQQILNTLEEERVSRMKDFNDKLTSLQ